MIPWFHPQAGLRVILGPARCRWCEYPVWLGAPLGALTSAALWLEIHRGPLTARALELRQLPANELSVRIHRCVG